MDVLQTEIHTVRMLISQASHKVVARVEDEGEVLPTSIKPSAYVVCTESDSHRHGAREIPFEVDDI